MCGSNTGDSDIDFDFNESISDKVDTIVKLIKNVSQKRASKLGKSIKEDIEKRNKLLKIAHNSIAGWGIVEEYLSDDFASDSEDDRKIKAAPRRALQKQNIRRTNQRSSATTTKPPPSKPANNVSECPTRRQFLGTKHQQCYRIHHPK